MAAFQLKSPLVATTSTLSTCLLFFLLLSPGPAAAATSNAGELTVIWGRNKAEGSLREACDTGLYATVIISFLRIVVSGHGTGSVRYQTDLSGHDVSTIGADVKHCQTANNVTVLLSVDVSGMYDSPAAAARELADHLWNAFIGGGSCRAKRRPFGDAVLDGFDFYLAGGGAAEQGHFVGLVRRRLLAIHDNNGGGRALRVTVTPPCSRVLDEDMGGGGGELGVFERLHVGFYGEASCGYDYHETRPFWGAWHMWSEKFPAARLVVGLPATDTMRGWIDPVTLRDSVLPSVQDDNYGGIMIWDRYHDKLTSFSRAIDS